MNEPLDSFYHNWDSPAAFTGSRALLAHAARRGGLPAVQARRERVTDYLRSRNEWTLTNAMRRRVRANIYRCSFINQLMEVDLISLLDIRYANLNKSSYILVAVDCLSRFICLRALKNKSGAVVAPALESIFKEMGKAPRYLKSDAGGEFKAKEVQSLLKRYKVQHRLAHHEHKANLAENAVRRCMRRLTKYFIYSHSYKYVNILDKLATSLNRVPLASLNGRTPEQMMKLHRRAAGRGAEFDVWRSRILFAARQPIDKSRRDVREGDTVRLAVANHPLRKQYAENFTRELFKVRNKDESSHVPMFHLEDLNGHLVKGAAYPWEIVKTSPMKNDDFFEVEKILKTVKDKDGSVKHLVKWKNYNNSFNSYINAADLRDL